MIKKYLMLSLMMFNALSLNVFGADLVINEFLASNDSIVADQDGEFDDWIELYNNGEQAISLDGYYLTDDRSALTKWSFPDTLIAAHDYLIVWADDGEGQQGLHANFKLSASGEEILLVAPDLTVVDEIAFGEQTTNISSGRYPNGTGAFVTMTPTFSTANTNSNALLIDSDKSDISLSFQPGQSVDLKCKAEENQKMWVFLEFPSLFPDIVFVRPSDTYCREQGRYVFVFDGQREDLYYADSYPDSKIDFGVNNFAGLGQLIITIKKGDSPENLQTIQTIKLTEAVTSFTYNIEEVFARDKVVDVYLKLSEADWQAMLADPTAEEEKPGSITYNGMTVDNVSIRTKGNSSLMSVVRTSSHRYSFKVDMDDYVQGQTLMGLKKLNLNNNWGDPTFMRERLSYDLMRTMGLPTPRTAYVNLYINGELMGLYTAVEHVDSVFIERNFGVTDGDLYKAEIGSDLIWVDNSIESYGSLELKTNEGTSDQSTLLTMLDELNNGNDYESVIDIDEVLAYLAVSTVLTNLDSYQGTHANNFYLYEEKGVFSIIPWDFNLSFAAFNMGCSSTQLIEFMIEEPTMGPMSERPLIDKLLQNPEYLERYRAYIEALISGPFDPQLMSETIDETADLIRDYVIADPTKFYTTEEFEQSLTSYVAGDTGNVVGLKTFITKRVESIRNQLDGLSPASGDGSGNCEGGGFPGGLGPVAPDGVSLIDLASAAEKLGVTEEELREALGTANQGPPDFATAAQTLGVTEEQLRDALGISGDVQSP